MDQAFIEKLKARIRPKEGLKLEPYKCPTGHWTIGYGHNLEIDMANYHWINEKKKISVKDAEFLLAADVAVAIGNLHRVLPKFKTYSEPRQIALLDMMFNLGIGTFLEFVRMIAAIEAEDWDEAARQVIASKYAKQVGPRATEVSQMLKEG